jgi:hypothetical protein
MAPSRLYGASTLGSVTYGTDTNPEALFGLLVDWDQNGYFSGRNEARRLNDFTIRRGRRHYIQTNGEGFEQEDTGSLVATISDPDTDYVPFNTGSPLYGSLASNRRMSMNVVTPLGAAYDLMKGNISKVIPMSGLIPTVRLEAQDGWSLLRGQKSNITVVLQENVYTDEIVPLILNKANWPSDWSYDLNSGLDVQPYWWVDKKNAADAIFDIVHSELGRAFIKADGALAFRNRYFIEDPVMTITDADYIYDSLEINVPWEIQRNVVSVIVRPRTLKASQDLWSLPQVTPIVNGQTYEFYPEFTYNSETVPAKDVLDLVATTDYTANSAEDGSGTNLTSGLTVTKESLGNQAKITVYNGSGSNGYLTLLKIRGKPVVNDASVPLRASNIATNEDVLDFTLDVPWIQNVSRADAFDDFLLDFLSAPKQYITLTLKPDVENQFALDLGRYVRVNSAQLGVDANYSIAYIEHEYERRRNYTMTTLFLEPLPDIASYWQFGISAFGITTKFAP